MDKALINELIIENEELKEQLYEVLLENCRLEHMIESYKRASIEDSKHIRELVHEIDILSDRQVKTYDLSDKIC